MSDISLPTSIRFEHIAPYGANIVIEPCFPGYGLTLGNAVRRVLLSSLPGAAVTELKIKGVGHEFSTIPHVKEDAVEIILNVKTIRPKLLGTKKATLKVSAKGKKVLTAGDFDANSEVEVMNPDQVVCTLTDPASSVDMELTVEAGLGYEPVESRVKEKSEIGRIQLDAAYSPVQSVSFRIEHVRVGDATNFDKVVLGVTTDGTITPAEAFAMSAGILVEQFQVLASGETASTETVSEIPKDEEAAEMTETSEE